MITTKSGYKTALEESERDMFGNYTWRQAAANIDYQSKLAEAQARQLYGEDVATAYQAATQQRATVAGSNLGQGTKSQYQLDIENALSQAYEQSLANYQENVSNISTQYTNTMSTLDKTLEERSANMQTFQDEHYKYLEYLDKWRQDNDLTEDELNKFFDLTGWGKYYTDVPTYDIEGNVISTEKRLKTWEELSTPVRDEVTGEYISFYDNEGNLTRAGKNFFTQIENYYGSQAVNEGQTAIPSFASYLYDANPELYEWANTYNPYSYTPTTTGVSQNLGAFRQMLGINSDADEYRFLDYYGGLSKTQIDGVFNDVYSKLDTDNITMDNAIESFQELRGLVEQLGYTANDVDWEAAETEVRNLVNQYKSYKSEAEAQNVSTGISAGLGGASAAVGILAIIAGVAGTVFSAGLGAPAGAALIGAGSATLAGAGALAGATGAATMGTAAANAANAAAIAEEYANKSEQDVKDLYTGILTALTAEIQSKYTDMAIANGGVLASGALKLDDGTYRIGSTYDTLDKWATSIDTPMTDIEYNQFANQVASRSSDRQDYYVQGLGTGRNNDDIDITIGSTTRNKDSEFDLLCGDEVTNSRMIQYLNKYSTGYSGNTPAKGKLVVVAGKMYIYTAKGWRNVISDNNPDDVENAIKAFLQKK